MYKQQPEHYVYLEILQAQNRPNAPRDGGFHCRVLTNDGLAGWREVAADVANLEDGFWCRTSATPWNGPQVARVAGYCHPLPPSRATPKRQLTVGIAASRDSQGIPRQFPRKTIVGIDFEAGV